MPRDDFTAGLYFTGWHENYMFSVLTYQKSFERKLRAEKFWRHQLDLLSTNALNRKETRQYHIQLVLGKNRCWIPTTTNYSIKNALIIG